MARRPVLRLGFPADWGSSFTQIAGTRNVSSGVADFNRIFRGHLTGGQACLGTPWMKLATGRGKLAGGFAHAPEMVASRSCSCPSLGSRPAAALLCTDAEAYRTAIQTVANSTTRLAYITATTSAFSATTPRIVRDHRIDIFVRPLQLAQ